MRFKLPKKINNFEEAVKYLGQLHDYGMAYHCEDDVTDICWSLPEEDIPTKKECKRMNKLMGQIYDLPELKNIGRNTWCVCGYFLDRQLADAPYVMHQEDEMNDDYPLYKIVKYYNDLARRVDVYQMGTREKNVFTVCIDNFIPMS